MNYRQFLSLHDLDYICSQQCIFEVLRDSSVLVTGASGFLSNCILQTLSKVSLDYHLNVVITGLSRNISALPAIPNVDFLSYQKVFSESYTSKFDLIFHCASPSGVYQTTSSIDDLFFSNIFLIKSLIGLKKTSKSKFLYFSSGAVYSDSPSIYKSEKDLLHFNSSSKRNAYAVAKFAGETYSNLAHHNNQIDSYIVRVFHTYGPCMKIPDGRLINDLFYSITTNAPLILSGYPYAERSFCHISDLVRALFFVISYGQPGSPYNIGNPFEVHTAFNFASALSRICKESQPQVIIRQDAIFISKTTMNRDSIPNIEKLLSLGWKPQVQLLDGLKSCFY